MKLSIYGGRLIFYQWDTGQRLIVDGADMCEEVHFATRKLNGVLVVRIENQDGLRVANVPNILLQSAYPITAYVYYRNADNRETRYARVFGVKSREKPSDYVYTETEVLTYKKLEEKLDQMQGLIGDLTDLETESKDNLVDAINEAAHTVQSDWNQNDETQPDYVKNRPFYTEMLVTSIEGMEIDNIPTDGTLDQNIPLEIGQVWRLFYKHSNGNLVSGWENLEVQQAEDGTLYLGTPDVNKYPFYITTTSVKSNSSFVHSTSASSFILTGISGTMHEEVVHQIPAKYIKDMYYTGDPVETVLVEESTVTFEDWGGVYGATFPSTFEATVGDTYKVSWDGTVYESICVAVSEVPVSFIGNLSITGDGSDTGEPFVMAIMNGEGIQIASADTSDSHTFSISGAVVPVVKIDKKYLPSTIPFMEDGKIPEKYVQERFPNVTDIFGGRLIGGTVRLSTLANPYPNKTILNALTVEAFNAMLNNWESMPRQVMIDNNLANVSPIGSTSISVEWSECEMYSASGKPIAGAWVHTYKANIHEDTDNPGTMVSECAVIRVTVMTLT